MVESSTNNSTVARRQLSRELKKLRLESGISAEDVAEELGISLTTMSRIENGKTSVSVADAKAMCSLYGHPELADALASLAKASRTRSWYRAFSDVIPEWLDVYIGLEQVASSFREYQAQLVPGILQTDAYARAIFRTDHPDDPDAEIDRRVQLRLQRQALLTRRSGPPKWDIILDESTLHRPVGGPAVMSQQLERLIEVTDLPNVTVRIVPFSAGVHSGVTSGPFVLLDFPVNGSKRQPTEPTTVYVEGFTGALYSDEKDQVDEYQTAFEGIRRAALSPAGTKAAIERAIKEMKKT